MLRNHVRKLYSYKIMHIFFLALMTFIVTGCGKSKNDIIDVEKLGLEAQTIIDNERVIESNKILTRDKWTETIIRNNAIEVYITKDGLYLVIEEFFVMEFGLFIPSKSWKHPGKGTDPEYIKISDKVYYYQISG